MFVRQKNIVKMRTATKKLGFVNRSTDGPMSGSKKFAMVAKATPLIAFVTSWPNNVGSGSNSFD